MRIKSITVISVILTVLMVQKPVFADGSKLLRSCEILLNWSADHPSIGDRYDAGFCLGYISGVYDLNSAYQKNRKVNNPFFCAPERGVTNGLNASIVINYLEDHPEKLHQGNLDLTLAAFMDAFPCEK